MAETIVSGAPQEAPPSANQLPPGTQLMGMYEIGELVAAGGMGEVYRGRQVATDDEVAIKVIKADMAGNESAFALFKKEASSLHHLHHEAIVRYFAFGFDTQLKRPFLAMEFVDGESLSDLLKRGPMPFDQALVLLKRVASGLASAHEIGIIHRDISPDNVILKKGQAKRAKIIDFGIAKANNIGGATIIGDGFAGKHNYVSPEQLGLGTGEVTAKSDIYSLGLLMAEVLRGKPLEMSGNHLQIIERRRVVPPLDDVDERIRPLIARMLDPLPENRPESMQEIADWKPDVPVASVERQATVYPASAAQPAPGTTVRRRGRLTEMEFGEGEYEEESPRRRWPLFAGLGALVIAGGVAGFVLTRGLAPRGPADADTGPDVAIRQQARPPGVAAPPPALSMAPPRPATPDAPLAALQPTPEPPAPVTAPPVPIAPAPPALLAAPPPSTPAPPPVTTPAARPAEPERPGLTAQEIVERLTRPAAPAPTTGAGRPATPPAQEAESPDAAFNRAFQSGNVAEMIRLAGLYPNSPLAAVARAQAEQLRRSEEANRQQLASAPATAASPPPVAAPAPAPPVARPRTAAEERAQPIIDYIRYYSGGRCFFIGPVDVTDSRATVEGYGAEVAPFAAFDRDFQQVNGFEAKVQLRLITQAQCPVTSLLRRVDQGRDPSFRFDIVDMNVRPGQNLVGVLDGQGARKVNVILMADDGKLSLLPIRQGSGSRSGSLEASMRISQEDISAKKPKVLLAIASDQDLQTLAQIDRLSAERFFEALGDEIAGLPRGVALVARYAVVERR